MDLQCLKVAFSTLGPALRVRGHEHNSSSGSGLGRHSMTACWRASGSTKARLSGCWQPTREARAKFALAFPLVAAGPVILGFSG